MKSAKTTISLFLAVIPILYFGGMAYYLWGTPGRLESATGLPSGLFDGVMTKQLGPTVLGLTGIAILCAFVFLIRVVRASSRVSTTPAGAVAVDEDEGEPFDADAALARYMARKATLGADAAAQPDPAAMAPPVARGFGRKAV